MKEQGRNSQDQINEEEISKLPEKEFRIMRVQMIKNLENKMQKMQQSINKDLEELKNKQTNNSSFNYSKESVFRQFRTSPASHSCEALNSHMWPEKPIQAG